MISRKIFSQLAEIILEGGAIKATKYFSERETVKATLRGKLHRSSRNRSNFAEILFTIGPPNYEERQFIKQVKKAKEPFPIKKIQIKWPKKK